MNIKIINPNEEELNIIQEQYNIDGNILKAALDQEEVSRFEFIEKAEQALILINAPMQKYTGLKHLAYDTIPVGIILAKDILLVIILKDVRSVEKYFKSNKLDEVDLFKSTLDLIYTITVDYLKELRKIDVYIDDLENNLSKNMKNDYLIHLMNLEKNLVYFQTALKANEKVLNQIFYQGDETLNIDIDSYTNKIEDIFIELNQAQEMVSVNIRVIRTIREATASIISNNLNDVMKILASFTIILTIPTMIFSFFGMNTNFLSFGDTFSGTFLILIASLFLSYISYKIMKKKNMF